MTPRLRASRLASQRSGATLLVAGLAALLLGATAVVYPIALLAILGLAAFLAALRFPKAAVAVCVVIAVFASTFSQLSAGRLDWADEAAVAAVFSIGALTRFRSGRWLRTYPGLAMFFAFAVTGVLSSALREVPVAVTTAGLLLALKGVFLAVGVAQLDWTIPDLRCIARGGATILLLILGSVVANLALGSAWSNLFTSYDISRLGGVSYTGVFRHPLELGNVLAVLAAFALSWLLTVAPSRLATGLVTVSAMASFGTLRRTAIAATATTLLFIGFSVSRSRTIVVAVLAGGVAAVLFLPEIVGLVGLTESQYFSAGETQARTRLYAGALSVAEQYFPFGAGFGRFGSFEASAVYSPEYIRLGFAGVWGLSPFTGNASFLTDTAWPAIYGEAGVFGLVFFLAGLVLVWRGLSKAQIRVPEAAWFCLGAKGALVALLLVSLAMPVFSAAPFYPLLLAPASVAYALRADRSHLQGLDC